ncbi:MAG TPA: hypothetical protein VLM37_08815 [Fibrobacteraceae bacterium]|nr:hypothetical protein [Fibrobacteraceae bacterium]
MSIRKTALLLSCALGLASTSFAARPFATADAGTVEPNHVEMEVAADYGDDALTPSLGFTLGLTDRCDLALSSAYTTYPKADRGTDPLGLTLKMSLWTDHLALAATGALGDSEWQALAIASHELGNLNLNANVGFDAVGGSNEKEALYNIAANYAVGPVHIGAEYLGVSKDADTWGAGAQWEIQDWVAVDAGVHANLSTSPTWTFTTGLWTTF